MASSAAGHRQSQLPSTRRPISPKKDWPSGRSSPGLTSEEARSEAIRTLHIRGRDTQRPASLRAEVLRPPDAGCRLRVGVRMDPSGLIESALPPRRQHRLSQTGLTYRKQAASSARLIWSVWSGQGTWVGAAPPCRSLVEPAYPKAGPELSLPKLKGFLIRRPDGFSSSPPLGAQGVRCRTARETYRLSCQRSLSHLTLMGFRPLQRLGQRKRPTPDSPSGCATLSGFLNLSAFYSSP